MNIILLETENVSALHAFSRKLKKKKTLQQLLKELHSANDCGTEHISN